MKRKSKKGGFFKNKQIIINNQLEKGKKKSQKNRVKKFINTTKNKKNNNDCVCPLDKGKKVHCSINIDKNKLECNKSAKCPKKCIYGCKEDNTCNPNLLTGYEPPDNERHWSNKFCVKGTNCYYYAINNKDKDICKKCYNKCKGQPDCPTVPRKCSEDKPQPCGVTIGRDSRNFTCENVKKCVFDDTPGIISIGEKERCPPYHYKAALAVADDVGYHFWRQGPKGNFSHKQGSLPPTDLDADGKHIYSVEKANRIYPNLKYKSFCGYFCVPPIVQHRVKGKTNIESSNEVNNYVKKIISKHKNN